MDLNEVTAETEVQLEVIGQSLVRGYVNAGAVRGDGVARGVPGDGVSQLGVAVNENWRVWDLLYQDIQSEVRESGREQDAGERRTGREGDSRPRGTERVH